METKINKEKRYLAELFELLRIPSISAKVENKDDCRRAALWLMEKLTLAGVKQVELCETAGNPIV